MLPIVEACVRLLGCYKQFYVCPDQLSLLWWKKITYPPLTSKMYGLDTVSKNVKALSMLRCAILPNLVNIEQVITLL